VFTGWQLAALRENYSRKGKAEVSMSFMT
jgi:hypothetical protein